jgi:hypothetical protein
MSLQWIAVIASLTAVITMETAVSRLGPQSDYKSIEEVATFGCKAVPLLVDQLEVVPEEPVRFLEKDRHPLEMRVLWSIAALRFITGKDFYAEGGVRRQADSPRDQMLTIGVPKGSAKFFGIWMSRGIVYFAPKDQQSNIIRKWRRYSSAGACKKPMHSSEDSQFWLYGINPKY